MKLSLNTSGPPRRAAYAVSLGLVFFSLLPSGVRAGVRVERGSGRLYVLSVGIDTNFDGKYNLRFAQADAISIAQTLSEQSKRMAFTSVISRSLIGKDATVTGIRSAMQEIAKVAGPDDTFLLYFGGLGRPQKNSYAFATSETILLDDNTYSDGLFAEELASLLFQIPARKDLLVLDTYNPIAATQAIRGALQPEKTFANSPREVAFLANAGGGIESTDLGHGLLTYCFLEGIQGAADVDHSGLITEARLEGFLTWRMPELAAAKNISSENLYSYSTLRDLVLVPVKSTPKIEEEATRGFAKTAVAKTEVPKADLGKDWALFVGTDHYAPGWRTLANPIADVKAVRQELSAEYGYDSSRVFEVEDATGAAFEDKLAEVAGQKYGPNDRLLVYIAGHGLKGRSDGYLVFSDTESPAEDPRQHTAMPFSLLRNELDTLPVKHILLVMDVCYGGQFDERGGFHGLLGGAAGKKVDRNETILRAMDSDSRIYLTSGDENHEVSDGQPGAHSPFSRALLNKLQERGGAEGLLDITTLYSSLRTLPVEPRAGYFYPGTASPKADFLFIPSAVPDPGR